MGPQPSDLVIDGVPLGNFEEEMAMLQAEIEANM